MTDTAVAPARSLASRLAGGDTVATLAVVLVALLLVFGLVLGERLFSAGTLQSMAFQLPELGILSLAMMITLLSGGLNLAIIATANLCGLTMAYVLTTSSRGREGVVWVVLAGRRRRSPASPSPPSSALINGYVIAYLGVSPILATLGTMTMCKGSRHRADPRQRHLRLSGADRLPRQRHGRRPADRRCSSSSPVHPDGGDAQPHAVRQEDLHDRLERRGDALFRRRHPRASSSRSTCCRACSPAVAALVMMARFNSANASYGESYLLVTILAAVLGGIDPFGGFGKVSGLVLSLIILQVISSAFNLIGLSQFLTLAIWGVLLIATSVFALIYRTQFRS